MDKLKAQILEYLRQPDYKPIKAKALSKKIGVRKKNQADFQAALEELLAGGQIKRRATGLLSAPSAPGLIAGIIRRIASGGAYFIPHERLGPETERDLYISPEDVADAHTGDEVLVRLLKRVRRDGQHCGRVEQVLERATNRFVGTYREQNGQGYVRVDGTTFSDEIFVGDPGAKGAQPDDKVVIEMLRFPSHAHEGEAVLVEVLGPRGAPGVDLQSIIREFALPDKFPDAVEEEARLVAQHFNEDDLEGRMDLTRETIVTIDPVDARDFDDAISLKRLSGGHWRLGVHIADVSRFVTPDSALDREAALRGNSVYLPGYVIPMLPELISNGLASLQEGRVRFVKSAFIEFTAEGIPVHTEFANAAIRVTHRFAYEEVLPAIGGENPGKKRITQPVRALLRDMHKLAMILRGRRMAAGALELHLREVKVDLAADGSVSGAHEVVHDESHQIIEEFMLAANVAVATKLNDLGIPFMRRVHGSPDELKLAVFATFARALGFPLEQFQSRSHLQELLDRVNGDPREHALNYALLRSMRPAEYTGREEGHYALAVENYCHFTSPIRRYPDLTIHRLVDALVSKQKGPAGPNELELTRLGKMCSVAERRADAAERELTKLKLLTLMQDYVGKVIEAVITGVERFGVFCQGIELPVQGFLHVSWLSDGQRLDYDPATFSLTARTTGAKFQLGDKLKVRVANVDLDRRELDFQLVSAPVSMPVRTPAAGRSPARGKAAGRGAAGRKAAASGTSDASREDSGRRRTRERPRREKAGVKKAGGKKGAVPEQPRRKKKTKTKAKARAADRQAKRDAKRSAKRPGGEV